MVTLIEARPGAGKTTATRRLAELLADRGAALAGFVTEEIRERGKRLGFAIVTFDGGRGTLAHVRLPGPPKVGRYGVDLEQFERLALPALAAPADVVLIDELGKMELGSEAFVDAVTRLLDGTTPVVATVHAYRHPFTDRVKGRPDAEIVRLTRQNRDELPRRLADALEP
ncbi:MAG TPA: NTPase [Solirubrobacterales bacterium]|nr:NTPase [Solirubrobacterales bacterium]